MRLEDIKDQYDDIVKGAKGLWHKYQELPEVYKDLVVAALAGGAGFIIGAWIF